MIKQGLRFRGRCSSKDPWGRRQGLSQGARAAGQLQRHWAGRCGEAGEAVAKPWGGGASLLPHLRHCGTEGVFLFFPIQRYPVLASLQGGDSRARAEQGPGLTAEATVKDARVYIGGLFCVQWLYVWHPNGRHVPGLSGLSPHLSPPPPRAHSFPSAHATCQGDPGCFGSGPRHPRTQNVKSGAFRCHRL